MDKGGPLPLASLFTGPFCRSAFLGAPLGDVLLHHPLPLPLRFKDVFDCVAEGAIASRMRRDVVCFFFYFFARVLDCDGEAAVTHNGKIDHIVAYESGLARFQSLLLEDFFERSALVLDALVDVLQFQVPSAQGNGLGNALGDEAGLDSGEAGQGDGRAVVRMKSLRLDQSLASEAEASLSSMFGSVLERGLLEPGGSGKDEEFAVSENYVNVKEKKFDFFRALAGHGGILAGEHSPQSATKDH